MSTLLRIATVSILAALSGAAAAEFEPAPPVVVKESGATFEQFCTEEGSITIEGSNNQATIDGPCANVTIKGSGNVVHIARTNEILVDGDRNTVDWRSSAHDGAAPSVKTQGTGNRVITYDEALAKQR
ncbi:MAG TPA: DUF3060 domain-containing protein [Tahibacter sp.]|nr:DUF3060 domain-containing protein [Tahibacter sp.]